MTLWKLGCRWGSNTPLFYNFIKEKGIVVGWENKKYNIGDWLLLTDGYTVLGFANVLEPTMPCTNLPELENSFIQYQIPFESRLIYAKANFIELNEKDRFEYPLQQGIVRVHSSDVVNNFSRLLKKYQNKIDMVDTIKILSNKKQIILQGPPGTGKTYTAKDIAYKMIFNEELSHQKDNRTDQLKKLESLEQFKLVQFHPSYSYEDFVRGIVAKPNPDGEGIVYEAENKTFGHFAKLALHNYLASQGIQNTNSDFENRLKILLEEINNKIDLGETYKFANKSTAEIISIGSDYLIYSFPNRLDIRYKLLFSDIEKIYNKRTDIKIPIDLRDKEKELLLEMKGKYPYYFMILEKLNKISNIPSINNKVEELKNYILIIDEINRANLPSVLGELIYALEYRGSEVSSMYEVNGKKTIIIPENLFIIGTMNTADRSVGHIDYAIRRRFAFVNILPNNSVIENEVAKALFEEITNLFESKDTLASDFKKEQVQLGHSYFIVKDEEELNMRAKYEIIPILEEYLKDGILLEKAEKIILDLKKRFAS